MFQLYYSHRRLVKSVPLVLGGAVLTYLYFYFDFSRLASPPGQHDGEEAASTESPRGVLEIPSIPVDQLPPKAVEAFEEAESALRKQATSDNWGAMGQLFLAHGLQQQALTCFERAAEMDPENVRWPYYAATCESTPAKQLEWYQRSVELEPNYAPVWAAIAKSLRELDKNEEAVAAIKRAIDLAPSEAALRLTHAQLLVQLDQNAQAEQVLNDAIGLPSATKAIPLELARIAERINDSPAAERWRQQASLYPESAPPLNDPRLYEIYRLYLSHQTDLDRGMDLAQKKQFARAIPLLRTAVAQDPDSIKAQVWLAATLVDSSQVDEGTRILERLSESHPEDMRIWSTLAVAYVARLRWADGVAAYQKAESLAPDDPTVALGLGVALKELERLEEAAEKLAHYESLQPEDRQGHILLGLVLQELNKPADAAAAFERAVIAAPDDWEARVTLAHALISLDRHPAADEHLTAAERIARGNATVIQARQRWQATRP